MLKVNDILRKCDKMNGDNNKKMGRKLLKSRFTNGILFLSTRTATNLLFSFSLAGNMLSGHYFPITSLHDIVFWSSVLAKYCSSGTISSFKPKGRDLL